MLNRKNSNRIYNLFVVLIYVLFGVYLCFNLNDIFLNYDESFTFSLIHKSFSKIIYLTSMDVHPFLYYFIAKIFIFPFKGLIPQIRSLRILSAIPYLILLIVGNTTIKHHFNKKASLLFMFFVISMPLLTQYIYILRMYSLAMMSITLVFLLFTYIYYRYIRNSYLNSVWISLFTLVAIYSQYISIIDLFLIYLSFFVIFINKKIRIRYMIFSGVLVSIGYSPWLLVLFKQAKTAQGSFWSAHVTLSNIAIVAYQIFSPLYAFNTLEKLIYLIIFIFILILFVILFIKGRNYRNSIIDVGLITFVGNFILFLLFSLLIHHTIFISRYFVLSLGILYLSLAIFLSDNLNHSGNIKLIRLLSLLLVVVGLFSYIMNINVNVYDSNSQFKYTYTLLKNIPRRSYIIYGGYYNTPVPSFSSYKHKSIVISKPIHLYSRVFDLKSNSHVIIHKYNHYYFVKPLSNENKSSKHFYKKYKNDMKKLGIVKCPNPNNLIKATIYKIK